jgi:hypothetical protein
MALNGMIGLWVKGVMHRIAVTVFPETTQSYILLSCLESEKTIYQKIFNQLKNSTVDKNKILFFNGIATVFRKHGVKS